MNAPLQFIYEGDGEFKAAGSYWAKRADEQYVIGERYHLTEWNDRSEATHGHQFAWIAEAWRNLPERYAMEPWAQTPEHLRKYSLIRCGFCKTDTYACGSKAEAERWARNLRPLDEYTIVTVQGTTVYRYSAESQSRRLMGKARFQQSKSAILEFIAGLLEVEPSDLQKAEAA